MFIACDESRAGKYYFVLGSVWVPKESVSEFERCVSKLRLHFKCWGEVKWSKISDHTPESIMRFYKAFIESVSDMDPFFRFIVVDTERSGGGEIDERMQLQFMRLLISRNAVRGGLRERVRPNEIHIIFDQFQESRQSRNEGWRKETRDFLNRSLGCEIEHFQPCVSHINSLLQLADLVTSMLSEIKNAGVDSLSENRKQLAHLIWKYDERFDVWNWEPGSKHEG